MGTTKIADSITDESRQSGWGESNIFVYTIHLPTYLDGLQTQIITQTLG